jgi:NAD(P)-dependent dehydrogenase (short-subunit alcohol dehydrogenase family)
MEWYRERFADKTVLVTGVSSGIGKVSAERLLTEGATVVGADVGEPPEFEDKDLPVSRSSFVFVQTDVQEEDAAVEAVSAAVEVGGRLDGVVHAAGVAGGGMIHLMDRQEWDRIIAVNLTGTFVVAKASLAQMLSQDRIDGERGSFVAVAGLAALETSSGAGPYGSAANGVVALCRTLAVEYGRMGIRANAACPSIVNGPMTNQAFAAPGLRDVRASFRDSHALQRFAEPEEVAAVVLFLLTRDASFVSGASVMIDGGYTAGRDHGLAALFEMED